MNSASNIGQYLQDNGYAAISIRKTPVGHFELDAEIDDTPVLLLVDTGASNTVIDEQTAKTLQIKSENVVGEAVGCVPLETGVQSSVVDTLSLGDLRLESFPLFIIDLSSVNTGLESHGAQRVDGVIGSDILASRSAVIDYSGSTLYLK